MTLMIVVTVAHRLIKIINKHLQLYIIEFMTLLSSDKNNQLLSDFQSTSREDESLISSCNLYE